MYQQNWMLVFRLMTGQSCNLTAGLPLILEELQWRDIDTFVFHSGSTAAGAQEMCQCLSLITSYLALVKILVEGSNL